MKKLGMAVLAGGWLISFVPAVMAELGVSSVVPEYGMRERLNRCPETESEYRNIYCPYVIVGHNYLLDFSDDRYALNNHSLGGSVSAGWMVNRRGEIGVEYAKYLYGLSLGFLTMTLNKNIGSVSPYFHFGFGPMKHQTLGILLGTRVGFGVNYFLKSSSGIVGAVGFATSFMSGSEDNGQGGSNRLRYFTNSLSITVFGPPRNRNLKNPNGLYPFKDLK